MSLKACNQKLEGRYVTTMFAADWNLLEKKFRTIGERPKSETRMPFAQIVSKDKLKSLIHSQQSEVNKLKCTSDSGETEL